MYFRFLFILFFTQLSFAQSIFVNGVIKDSTTKKPIEFCSVTLLNSTFTTLTDENGKFTLEIPHNFKPSPFIIAYSFMYNPDTIKVQKPINEYVILLTQGEQILNEVVVTGESKATLIRETPIAISTISQKMIEQTTASNIIDVLVRNTPGLNAVKTGPNISKPFIRGLGYNRVLTLYDGIRQEGQQWGDEHGIEVDAYNIEKAEVIKGPASLLYGSDALAGVVSLILSLPKLNDGILHGKFLSEYQSNNGLIGNALSLNYGKGKWRFGMNSSFRLAQNYANKLDKRVYNTGFQEGNFAATIRHVAESGHTTIRFTLYDNKQGIPDGSRDSLTRKFTQQIYEGSNDDLLNRPIVADKDLNTYKLSPLHQHIQHYRFYVSNSYQLKKGDMKGMIALQQNIRREYNHPTENNQAGLFIRLNTLNYSLTYNLPTFKNIDIAVGLNGMGQESKHLDGTDFPIPNYMLFDGGIFTYLKWKRKKWTIGGGIRYDIRYLNVSNLFIETDTTTGFQRQSDAGNEASKQQFSAFKKTFIGLSASIGSTFRISKAWSFKINIARAYRAPNISELGSNGLDPGAHIIYLGDRNFSPEFSLQEDIGFDFTYKSISGNLSLFNNNIKNFIYLSQLTDNQGNSILDNQGNKTYQYQQESAQIYGLEASVSIRPSKVKGFQFDTRFSMVYGYNRKIAYKNQGINGEYLPFIPPMKILNAIQQSFTIKNKVLKSIDLRVELDLNASQKRYLALSNTETYTSGYTLFNAALITKIKYKEKHVMQIQFQVNNVFNTLFQSNLSRLKYYEYYRVSTSGKFGIYGMGRNFCVKLIIPF